MPTMHDYLVEQQKFARKKLSDLLENQSVYNFKWKFADSLAEVMVIQFLIDHKDYGNWGDNEFSAATSARTSNMLTLINDRKKLLSDETQLAQIYNKDALINMVTNEKGEVDSPEKIKERFLKQTGRTDILTEDELRPDYYWLGVAQRQARLDWEAAFSKEEISPDDARFQLATSLALQKMLGGRKASQKAVKEALEKRRKEILQDPVFQKAIEGKNGAQIAAICGEYDPQSKQFTSFVGENLDYAYAGAIAGSLIPAQLDRLREDFTKEPYNPGNVRTHLAQALALDRVQRGLLKTRPPKDIEKWGDVDKLRGEFFKDSAFNRIMKMDKEALGALCGTVDPNTKEFKPFAIEDLRNNLRPVYEKYREQRKQEKAAKKARLKEEAEKKAAEEARLKEEAEKKAAEEARLKEEAEKKAAEEARLKEEAEKKAAEEARLKEEAEKKAAEEARLKEEAEKKAAEEARLKEEAEKKAAEEARLKEEAEKKAAEEARLKEEAEKKAAEEARLKEEAEKKAAEEAKLKEAQEKAAQEQPEQQSEWPRERLQQADLTPHMAWRMMYGDEQQAEEQPKVEEQPFDSMAEIAAQQRYWAEELKKQLISETTTYYQILRPLCQLRALQEMKESGYVGESENDISRRAQTQSTAEEHKSANVRLTLRNTKSQLMRMFGKTENGVYQIHSPEQLVRAFADGVEQTEKNSERWGQMASLSNTALNSEGEERRSAVATLVAMQRIYYGEKDANKTNTSLKKISDEQRVENLARFMLKEKAFQEIADSDQLDAYLRGRDFEALADKVQRFRKERSKEAAQEKAGKTDRENVLRAREEAERKNALSDEVVAGLDMDGVANQLYAELGKLGNPLSDAYGNEWRLQVEDAQHFFIDYNGSEEFKESIGKTEQFLDTKLSDGKTIGEFARENKLLGGNFDKLMKRAGEIANPERQAEQPQAEKKVEERAEEQPEAEEEQEQPELTNKQSADLDESFVSRQPVQKTAASWIEGYKADLANRIRGNLRGDNYPAADIARIFAARELSKSVRGKKSTLGELMNEQQISERAAKIMENKSFKDFAAKLSKGENLSKVEAIFKKTHSHGGELDDMFRDYLTKRPAGELENDPDLKRWMPTVKKRVEFLQSEAAKVQKKNETPYKEAAEILLLRQAAEVKRGGKGLEANVPVIGEKGVTSLQNSVKNYTDDPKFKEAFNQPDVKKYILSGHGGEMAERYNKQPEAKKIEQKQQNGQEKGV